MQNRKLLDQRQPLEPPNHRAKRGLLLAIALLAMSIAALAARLPAVPRAQIDEVLRRESRLLAALSGKESERGDHMSAILLALEALPDPRLRQNRPLTVEAEAALRHAWLQNREVAGMIGHDATVTTASFSPDGSRIVTASLDGTARVWDASGRPIATMTGHGAWVTAANFSPDGSRIVAASAGGILAAFNGWSAGVWELSGRPVATLTEHEGSASFGVGFFRTSGTLSVTVSRHTEGIPDRSWSHTAGKTGPWGWITVARFNQDGSRIVTASENGTAQVWTLSGDLVATLTGHTGGVTDASFSPDGSRIVIVSDNGPTRVWTLSGDLVATLTGHTGKVRSASFSADGSRIIIASDDGTARVWGLSGPTPTATLLTGHTGWFMASFSPDSTRIVIASEDNIARVWDLSEPIPKATLLTGHTGWVRAARFSPDGSRIVTASRDHTARVWDLSGNIITTLIGHTGRVTDARFSPDGTQIVTAATDKTARVWDLSGLSADPLAVPFSSDATRAVTASADGAIGDYAFPELSDLIKEIRDHLPRCLTRAQWSNFGVATSDGDRDAVPTPAAHGLCPR